MNDAALIQSAAVAMPLTTGCTPAGDVEEGDFSIPPDRVQAYADVTDMPRCDTVCLCLKTTAERRAGRTAAAGSSGRRQRGAAAPERAGSSKRTGRAASSAASVCYGRSVRFSARNKVGPGHIQASGLRPDQARPEHRADGSPAGIDPIACVQIAADFAPRPASRIDLSGGPAARPLAEAGVEHPVQRPERSCWTRPPTRSWPTNRQAGTWSRRSWREVVDGRRGVRPDDRCRATCGRCSTTR
jgi:hypothetical protein